MSIAQPVQFSVDRPDAFERVHVVVRIGICFVQSWLSSFGLWIILLAGPIVPAIIISHRGAEGFHERSGAMYRKALRFLMRVEAYRRWTTDAIPNWNEERTSHRRIQSTGTPTVVAVLWLVALVAVLINRSVPDGVRNFQLGYLTWVARTLAYYLSIVEEYPPFLLERSPEATAQA